MVHTGSMKCCVKLQVDSEMRVLLNNMKEMVEAERAAKAGKKGKKKKGGKGGKKKGAKKEKGAKGSKRKDPTVSTAVRMKVSMLVFCFPLIQ